MRSIFIPALIAGALLLGACGQAGTAQTPTAAIAPAELSVASAQQRRLRAAWLRYRLNSILSLGDKPSSLRLLRIRIQN